MIDNMDNQKKSRQMKSWQKRSQAEKDGALAGHSTLATGKRTIINRWLYLSALAIAGFTSLAYAQTTEERLYGCAGFADKAQRLTCFDDLARDVMSNAKPDKISSQSFGLEHKDTGKDLIGVQQAIVKELKKNAYGAMVLTLDNGQVWEQKDTKTMSIHDGDAVLIERGAMSAFYLTAQGNKRMRVARVK